MLGIKQYLYRILRGSWRRKHFSPQLLEGSRPVGKGEGAVSRDAVLLQPRSSRQKCDRIRPAGSRDHSRNPAEPRGGNDEFAIDAANKGLAYAHPATPAPSALTK